MCFHAFKCSEILNTYLLLKAGRLKEPTIKEKKCEVVTKDITYIIMCTGT